MTYQPQDSHPPVQRRRMRWILVAVAGLLGLVVVLAVIGALIGSGKKDPPAGGSTRPAPVATSEPTRTSSSAAGEADSQDLGAGRPGAHCATNRLGKHFTKDGVRYTCKGPKPYEWRRD